MYTPKISKFDYNFPELVFPIMAYDKLSPTQLTILLNSLWQARFDIIKKPDTEWFYLCHDINSPRPSFAGDYPDKKHSTNAREIFDYLLDETMRAYVFDSSKVDDIESYGVDAWFWAISNPSINDTLFEYVGRPWLTKQPFIAVNAPIFFDGYVPTPVDENGNLVPYPEPPFDPLKTDSTWTKQAKTYRTEHNTYRAMWLDVLVDEIADLLGVDTSELVVPDEEDNTPPPITPDPGDLDPIDPSDPGTGSDSNLCGC